MYFFSKETDFELTILHEGEGKEPVLTFPGFGNAPSLFNPMVQRCPHAHFHHVQNLLGNFPQSFSSSAWNRKRALFLEQLIQYLQGLEGYVTLVAFSIGARPALNLLKACPEKIREVVLVAPDGIVEHPIFQFATRTHLGNFLFYQLTFSSKILPRLLLLFGRVLSMKPLARWASNIIKTPQKRRELYHSWMMYGKMGMSSESLLKYAEEHNILLWVVTGKKDRVIREKALKPFLSRLPASQHIQFDVSHNKLPQVFFNSELARSIGRAK